MRMYIDEDLCIECGVCPDMCPEVFDLPDGEKAKVKLDPVPAEHEAAAQEAEESCPVDAICHRDE